MEEEERKKKLLAGKEKLAAFRNKKGKKKKTSKREEVLDTSTPDVGTDDKCETVVLSAGDVSSSFEDSDQLSASDESFSEDVECRSNLRDSKAYLTLKSEFKNCVERIADLEETVLGKQSAINQLTRENDQLRKQITDQDEKSSNEKELTSNSQLIEYKAALSKRDELIKRLTERLQSSLQNGNLSETYGNETESLAQQVQGLQSQLQQAGESLRVQLTQQHISAKALQDAKAEIMALQENILQRDNLVSQLNTELLETKDSYNSLELRYSELQLQFTDTDNMLTHLRSINKDNNNMYNSHTKSAEDFNDNTRSDIDVQQLLAEYKIKLNAMNEKMEKMEQEKSNLLSSELSKVSEEYQSVIHELEQAQHLLHNYHVQADEYECKLTNLQEQAVLQEDTLLKLQQENLLLTEERNCQLQQNEELKNKINNDQSYIVDLQSELDKLKNDNEIYCEQHNKLSEMFVDQNKDLEYMEILKDENKRLQTHNSDLQYKVSSLDTEIHELKQTLQSSISDSTSPCAKCTQTVQVPTLKEIIFANDKCVCDMLEKYRTLESRLTHLNLSSALSESDQIVEEDIINKLESVVPVLNAAESRTLHESELLNRRLDFNVEPLLSSSKQTFLTSSELNSGPIKVPINDTESVLHLQVSCANRSYDSGEQNGEFHSNSINSACQTDETFHNYVNCDVSFTALVDRDMQTEYGANALPVIACMSDMSVQTELCDMSNFYIDAEVVSDVHDDLSRKNINDYLMYENNSVDIECTDGETRNHLSDSDHLPVISENLPVTNFTNIEVQTDECRFVLIDEESIDRQIQTLESSLTQTDVDVSSRHGRKRPRLDEELSSFDKSVIDLVDKEVQIDCCLLANELSERITQPSKTSLSQLSSELLTHTNIESTVSQNDSLDGYTQIENIVCESDKVPKSETNTQTERTSLSHLKAEIVTQTNIGSTVSQINLIDEFTQIENIVCESDKILNDSCIQTDDMHTTKSFLDGNTQTKKTSLSHLESEIVTETNIESMLSQVDLIDECTQIEDIFYESDKMLNDSCIQTDDTFITKSFLDGNTQTEKTSVLHLKSEIVTQTDIESTVSQSDLIDKFTQIENIVDGSDKMLDDSCIQTVDTFTTKSFLDGNTQTEKTSVLHLKSEIVTQTDIESTVSQSDLIDKFTQIVDIVDGSDKMLDDSCIQTVDTFTTKSFLDGNTQTEKTSVLHLKSEIVTQTDIESTVSQSDLIDKFTQIVDIVDESDEMLDDSCIQTVDTFTTKSFLDGNTQTEKTSVLHLKSEIVTQTDIESTVSQSDLIDKFTQIVDIVDESDEMLDDSCIQTVDTFTTKSFLDSNSQTDHLSLTETEMQTDMSLRDTDEIHVQTDNNHVFEVRISDDEETQTENMLSMEFCHHEMIQTDDVIFKSQNDFIDNCTQMENVDYSVQIIDSDGDVQPREVALLAEATVVTSNCEVQTDILETSISDEEVQTEECIISEMKLFVTDETQTENILQWHSISNEFACVDVYTQVEDVLSLSQTNFCEEEIQTDDVQIMSATKVTSVCCTQTNNESLCFDSEAQTDTVINTDVKVQMDNSEASNFITSTDETSQIDGEWLLQLCSHKEVQTDSDLLSSQVDLIESCVQTENIDTRIGYKEIQTEDISILLEAPMLDNHTTQTEQTSFMETGIQSDNTLICIDQELQTDDQIPLHVKLSEHCETQTVNLNLSEHCETQTENLNFTGHCETQTVDLNLSEHCETQTERFYSAQHCETQTEDICISAASYICSERERQTIDVPKNWTNGLGEVENKLMPEITFSDNTSQTDSSSINNEILKDSNIKSVIDQEIQTDVHSKSSLQEHSEREIQTDDIDVSSVKFLNDTESQTEHSLLLYNELETISVLNNLIDEVVQTETHSNGRNLSNGEVQTDDVCIVSPLLSYDEIQIANMNEFQAVSEKSAEVCAGDISADVFVYPDLNLTCDATFGSCNNSPEGKMSPVTEEILKPVSEALAAATQQSICCEPQQQFVSTNVEGIYSFPLMQSSAQLCALSNEVERLQVLCNKKDEEVLELQIKVVDFQSRISYFKEERKNLEENILSITQDKNTLNCECLQLSKMKQKLEMSNSSLRNEVSGLQNTLETLKLEMQTAEQKFDDDKDMLQNDLNYYQDKLLEAGCTIDKINANNIELERSKSEYEEKLEILQKQLDTTNDTYQFVRNENDILKNKLLELNNSVEMVTQLKNIDSTCQQSTVDQETIISEDLLEKTEGLNQQTSVTLENENLLENSCTKSSEMSDDLENKFYTMYSQSDLTCNHIEKLETYVDELQLEITSKLNDLEEKSERISFLEEKCTELECEKDKLVADVLDKSTCIATAEETLHSIVEEKASLLKELDEKAKCIAVLEKEKQCVTEGLNEKEAKIVYLENERLQIINVIGNESSNSTPEKLPSAVEPSEQHGSSEDVQSQVKHLVSACDSSCVQVESFSGFTSDFKLHDSSFVPLMHVQSKEETVPKMSEGDLFGSSGSTTPMSEVNFGDKGCHDIVKYIHNLKHANREHSCKSKEVEKDNGKLKEKINKLLTKMVEMKERYASLKDTSEKEKCVTADLRKDNEQKEMEIEELRNITECLKEESAMFEMEVKNLSTQLVDYSDKNNNILVDCQQKQFDIDKLSSEVRHYKDSLLSYESQATILQARVDDNENQLVCVQNQLHFVVRENQLLEIIKAKNIKERDQLHSEITLLKEFIEKMKDEMSGMQNQLKEYMSSQGPEKVVEHDDNNVFRILEENEKIKQQLKTNEITFERQTNELNRKWHDELAEVSRVNLELKNKLKAHQDKMYQGNEGDIMKCQPELTKMPNGFDRDENGHHNLSSNAKTSQMFDCIHISEDKDILYSNNSESHLPPQLAAENVMEVLSFFIRKLNSSSHEFRADHEFEMKNVFDREVNDKMLEEFLVTFRKQIPEIHTEEICDRTAELYSLVNDLVTVCQKLKCQNSDLELNCTDLKLSVAANMEKCDQLEKGKSELQLKVKKVLSLLQKERAEFEEEKSKLNFEHDKTLVQFQEMTSNQKNLEEEKSKLACEHDKSLVQLQKLTSNNKILEEEKLLLQSKYSGLLEEKQNIEEGVVERIMKIEELYNINESNTQPLHGELSERAGILCENIKKYHQEKYEELQQLRLDIDNYSKKCCDFESQIAILSFHVDCLSTENVKLNKDFLTMLSTCDKMAKLEKESKAKLLELSNDIVRNVKSYSRVAEEKGLSHDQSGFDGQNVKTCNLDISMAKFENTQCQSQRDLVSDLTATDCLISECKSDNFQMFEISSAEKTHNKLKIDDPQKGFLEYIQAQLYMVSEMSRDIVQKLDKTNIEKEELEIQINLLSEHIGNLTAKNTEYEKCLHDKTHDVNRLSEQHNFLEQDYTDLKKSFSELSETHETLVNHNSQLKMEQASMQESVSELLVSASQLKNSLKTSCKALEGDINEVNSMLESRRTLDLCQLVSVCKMEMDEVNRLMLGVISEKEMNESKLESVRLQIDEINQVITNDNNPGVDENALIAVSHRDPLDDMGIELNSLLLSVQEIKSMNKEKIPSLSSDVDTLTHSLIVTEDQVKSLLNSLSEKNTQLDDFKLQLAEMEKLLHEQSIQINLLSDQLKFTDESKVYLNSTIICMESNFIKKLLDSSSQNNTLKVLVMELDEDIKGLQTQCKTLVEDKGSLDERIHQLQEEKDKSCQEYEAKLEIFEKEKHFLLDEISELKTTLRSLEERCLITDVDKDSIHDKPLLQGNEIDINKETDEMCVKELNQLLDKLSLEQNIPDRFANQHITGPVSSVKEYLGNQKSTTPLTISPLNADADEKNTDSSDDEFCDCEDVSENVHLLDSGYIDQEEMQVIEEAVVQSYQSPNLAGINYHLGVPQATEAVEQVLERSEDCMMKDSNPNVKNKDHMYNKEIIAEDTVHIYKDSVSEITPQPITEQVGHLKLELENSDRHTEELKVALCMLDDELNSLRQKNIQLVSYFNQVNAKNIGLIKQNEKLLDNDEEWKKELDNQIILFQELEEKYSQLLSQCDCDRNYQSELLQEIDRHNMEEHQMIETINSLKEKQTEAANQQQDSLIEDLESEKQQLQQTIDDAINTVKDCLGISHDTESLTDLMKSIKNQLSETLAKENDFSDQISELKEKLQRLISERQDLKFDNESFQCQIKDIQLELKQTTEAKTMADNELKSYAKKFEAEQCEIEKLCHIHNSEKQMLELKYKELETANQSVENENCQLIAKCDSYTYEIDELKSKLGSVESSFTKELDERELMCQQLKEKLSFGEEKNEQVEMAVRLSEEKVTQLQKLVSGMEKELEELKFDNNQLILSVDEHKEALEKESGNKERIQELEAEFENVTINTQNQIEQYNSDIKKYRSQVIILQDELRSVEQMLFSSRSSATIAHCKFKQIERQISDSQSDTSYMMNQDIDKSDASPCTTTLQDRIKEILNEKSHFQCLLNESEKQMKNLEKQYADETSQLESKIIFLTDKTNDLSHLMETEKSLFQAKLSEAEKEIHESQEQCCKLDQIIATLKMERETEKADFELMQRHMYDIEDEVTKLESFTKKEKLLSHQSPELALHKVLKYVHSNLKTNIYITETSSETQMLPVSKEVMENEQEKQNPVLCGRLKAIQSKLSVAFSENTDICNVLLSSIENQEDLITDFERTSMVLQEECQKLMFSKCSLESTLNILNGNVCKLRLSNEDLSKQLETVKLDKSQISQSLQNLIEQPNNDFEDDLKLQMEKITLLESKLTDCETDRHLEIKRHESETKSLKMKLQQLQQELEKIRSDRESNESVVSSLEAECLNKSTTISCLQEWLTKSEETRLELEKQNLSVLEQLSQTEKQSKQVDTDKQELLEQLEQASLNIHDLETQLSSLKMSNTDNMGKLQNVFEEVNDRKSVYDDLVMEHETLKKDFNDILRKSDNLNSELHSVKNLHANNVHMLEDQIKVLEEELVNNKCRSECLLTEYEACKEAATKEKKEIQNKLNYLEQYHEEQISSLDKEKEKIIEEYNIMKETKTRDDQMHESVVKQLQIDLQEAINEKEDLIQVLTAVDEQIEKQTSEHNTLVEQLQQQITNLSDNEFKLEESIEHHRQQINKQTIEHEDKVRLLEVTISALQQENCNLKEKNEMLAQKHEDSAAELKSQKNIIDHLTTTKVNLEDSYFISKDVLEKEKSELEAQVKDLTCKLNDSMSKTHNKHGRKIFDEQRSIQLHEYPNLPSTCNEEDDTIRVLSPIPEDSLSDKQETESLDSDSECMPENPNKICEEVICETKTAHCFQLPTTVLEKSSKDTQNIELEDDLHSLEDELDQRNAENDLRFQSAEPINKCNDADSEQSLTNYKEKLSHMKRELEGTKQSHALQEQLVDELQRKLHTFRNQLEINNLHLYDAVHDLSNKMQSTPEESETWKNELDSSHANQTEGFSSFSDKDERAESNETILNELKSLFYKLFLEKVSLESENEDLKHSLTLVRDEMNKTRLSMDAKIEEISEEKNVLETDFDELKIVFRNEKDDFQLQTKALKNEIELLSKENTSLLKDVGSTAEITDKVCREEDNRNASAEVHDDVGETVEESDWSGLPTSSEKDMLKSEDSSTTLPMKKLAEEAEFLKKQLEMSKQFEPKYVAMREIAEGRKKEAVVYRERMLELNAELTQLKDDMTNLIKHHEKEMFEVLSIKSSLISGNVKHKYETEILQLQNKVQTLRSENESLHGSQSHLMDNLQASHEENKRCSTDLDVMKHMYSELWSQIKKTTSTDDLPVFSAPNDSGVQSDILQSYSSFQNVPEIRIGDHGCFVPESSNLNMSDLVSTDEPVHIENDVFVDEQTEEYPKLNETKQSMCQNKPSCFSETANFNSDIFPPKMSCFSESAEVELPKHVIAQFMPMETKSPKPDDVSGINVFSTGNKDPKQQSSQNMSCFDDHLKSSQISQDSHTELDISENQPLDCELSPKLQNFITNMRQSHEKKLKQKEYEMEEHFTRQLRSLQVDIESSFESQRQKELEELKVKHSREKEMIKQRKQEEFIQAFQKMKTDMERKYGVKKEGSVKHDEGDGGPSEASSGQLGEEVKRLHKENQELAEARDALLQQLSISEEGRSDYGSIDSSVFLSAELPLVREEKSFLKHVAAQLHSSRIPSEGEFIEETSFEQSDNEKIPETNAPLLNSVNSDGIFVREQSCELLEDTCDVSLSDISNQNNKVKDEDKMKLSPSDADMIVSTYFNNEAGIFVEESSEHSGRHLDEIALPIDEEIVEEVFIPEYSLSREIHPLENDVHNALADDEDKNIALSSETQKSFTAENTEVFLGDHEFSQQESDSVKTADYDKLRNLCSELQSKVHYYKTANEYLEQKFNEEHKKFIQEKMDMCSKIKLSEANSSEPVAERVAVGDQNIAGSSQSHGVDLLDKTIDNIIENGTQTDEQKTSVFGSSVCEPLQNDEQKTFSSSDAEINYLSDVVAERDAFLRIMIKEVEKLKIQVEEYKLRESFYKAKCENKSENGAEFHTEWSPLVESVTGEVDDISFLPDSYIFSPRFNSTEIGNAKSIRSLSLCSDSLEDSQKVRSNLDPEEDGHLALELKHFEIVEEVTRLRHDLRVTKAIYVRENALLQEALNRENFTRKIEQQTSNAAESQNEFVITRNMIDLRQRVSILTEENKSLRIENDRWMRRIQEQECLVIRLRELLGRNCPDVIKVQSAFKRQVLLLQNQREELLERLKKKENDSDNLSSVLCEKDLLAETLRREKLLLVQKLQEKHKIESELFEKKLEFEKMAGKQLRLEEQLYAKDQTEKLLMKQKRLLEMELSEIESKLEEREAELVEEKNELLNELKEKDSTIQRLAVSKPSDSSFDDSFETTSMIALPVSQSLNPDSNEISKPLKKAKLRHSGAIRALRSRLPFGNRDKKKSEKYSSDSSLQK